MTDLAGTPSQAPTSWRLALRLARRELRTGTKGFRIFLACIALGVATIAAVGSISEAMVAGLREDGRVLLGGDLDLHLHHREITAEQRAWLEARATISEVAAMRAMAQPTTEDAARRLVELRAVDDAYPLYGAAVLDPAADLRTVLGRRDGVWGAAVEASLLERLGVALGERIEIGELPYELRVLLVREPDGVARGLRFGPTVLVARDSLGETGLVQPGSLIHFSYRLRLPEGGDAVALRRELEDRYPEAGWRIRDTREAAPGVRRLLERLTLYLTLVGLTALLIGGLGVGNAVRAYLDGKVATIATLKCLGAPRRLVFKIYLVQIAGLALVGIAAGLIVGEAASSAVTWILGDRFGWQAAGGFYVLPLLLAALFGAVVAVTFTLPPLGRAGQVSPAALFRSVIAPQQARIGRTATAAVVLGVLALAGLAIWTANDHWLAFLFVCWAALSFLIFRLAGWAVMALARRLPRPRRPGLRLALANLHRPGAPTAAVVLSLGLGLTVLIAIAQIEGNLARQTRDRLPENAPALYFLDIQPHQAAAFDQTVEQVPGVQGLRRVPMLRGRIAAVNGTPPDELDIPPEIAWVFRGDRGLTWSRTPPPGAQLAAGTWWQPDHAGPPLVSLDAEVGHLLDIGPGDRLTINLLGRNFEAEIANLRIIDWTTLGINFVMVFSPGLLETPPQTQIAAVRVDPEAETAVEQAVTGRFANISAIRVREALAAVAVLIGHIATAVRVTGAIGIVAGLLVLAGAVAAGHERRVYESVVLKVLGARRRTLMRAYLVEYGLLGLVTAAIAAVIGCLAAGLVMTEVMEMPFTLLPGAAAGTALVGVAVTLALGFAGTWRALSRKSSPLLRNE